MPKFPIPRVLLLLLAVLATVMQSSCGITRYLRHLPPGNIVPSRGFGIVQAKLMYRDPVACVALQEGGFMLAHTGQRNEIYLVRLNDSLQKTAEYFSPRLRIEQRPLGLIQRNGRVDVVCANYQDGDSMSLVLRRIAPSTMEEIETKTIISVPQQTGPHYRSTYALAYSPDSSKVLIYNFDLTQATPSQPMIDLLLLDLGTGALDTARLPAFLPEDVRKNIDDDYSPNDIISRIVLTADSRAYVVYHQSPDSVHLACYDISRKTFTRSSLILPKASCLQEKPEFCNPDFMLDERGDLYVVARASSGAVIDGLTITKFDGRKSDPLYTRNISFSPSLIRQIKSVPGATSLIIVGLIFNPVTGGGTAVLQPRAEQERRIEDYNYTGLQPNYHLMGSSYVSGDIIAVTFDAAGEKVWESYVASNLLTLLYYPLPNVAVRYAGDSLEISYASDNVSFATDLYSITISQGTGGVGARRQILQYKGNSYFDLRRMIRSGAGTHLWYVNTINEDIPQLVRTWENGK